MLYRSGQAVPAREARPRNGDYGVDLSPGNEPRMEVSGAGADSAGMLTIRWRVPVWPHEPLSRRGPGNDAAAPVCLRAPAESWD